MPARFSPRVRFCLLLLLGVALLFTRLGGAHLHLCFDGLEPASSLHFIDSGQHADHHAGEEHDDRDVSLIADALAKPIKLSLEVALLLVLMGFGAPLFAPAIPRHRFAARITASPPFHLRPPLRGPPARSA